MPSPRNDLPQPDSEGWYTTKDGKRYRTNGCTLAPDGDWLAACERHDHSYVAGGGPWDRFKADLALWGDIWAIGCKKGWLGCFGYFWIGLVYFVGVRLFGWMLWRWWWCR